MSLSNVNTKTPLALKHFVIYRVNGTANVLGDYIEFDPAEATHISENISRGITYNNATQEFTFTRGSKYNIAVSAISSDTGNVTHDMWIEADSTILARSYNASNDGNMTPMMINATLTFNANDKIKIKAPSTDAVSKLYLSIEEMSDYIAG